ncbi:ABC transporter permease [Shinella sp. HZN7]|uniref:ABC transporter permease n=1 Tax=Shinella sp. (strain HZN7) TaxID=879274 RepID=UPI0007DA87CA|nr:ABC transporter permease subunit [Shinella sp. HZN7]ANH08243.1 ABC transporter permease [Shinella sp. HZN7]
MSYEILLQSIPIVYAGLKLTLIVTLAGFVLGQVLALPLGLALTARSPLLRWPVATLTFLLRGSPLLVQLFILYYGLAQFDAVRASVIWPIIREPVNCAIIAIGLNSAAYVAVIIAGGLKRLPPGQAEACISLGLSRFSRMRDVLLPQVYRAILPSIGNELILVLKASSLASAVTVMEMSGAARAFTAKTYAPFEVFIVAGLLYLAIGFLFGIAFRFVERRIPGVAAIGKSGRAAQPRPQALGASS